MEPRDRGAQQFSLTAAARRSDCRAWKAPTLSQATAAATSSTVVLLTGGTLGNGSSSYLWSDAWLLQAIALASQQRPATLAEVLAAADDVNHALPTDDELHGALVRLTQGGFVEELEQRLRLTEYVPMDVRAAIVTGGWKSGRAAASAYLGAEDWSPETNTRDSRNNVRFPGLTPERIRCADRERRSVKR